MLLVIQFLISVSSVFCDTSQQYWCIPVHYGLPVFCSWRRIRRLLFCITFDFLRKCTTCLRRAKFRVFSWEISIRFSLKNQWRLQSPLNNHRCLPASHYGCRKWFRKYSGPFLEISIAKTSLIRWFRWTVRGCFYASSCWRWIRGRRR